MRWLLALLFLVASACGGKGASNEIRTTPLAKAPPADTTPKAKEPPPASAAARDVNFPPVARQTLPNGLELNTVEWRPLPVVNLRLVIRSGSATNPANLPGLSQLVATMLKEGTKKRSSSALAEEVDYLGARLNTGADQDTVYISMSALSQDIDKALEIMADVALHPAFSEEELKKLKKRELDRLALQEKDPNFIAARTFYRTLYGEHPYAQVDTTTQVVEKLKRNDLQRWHKSNFLANRALLVVVGDVAADRVQKAAAQAFKKWKKGKLASAKTATTPVRDKREIVVVDRPESVQSVILIGNLALRRSDPDFVRLEVANQVLGGSPASRLFMDLRERRSLTYGAYSSVGERVDTAAFRASAAVRNEVTEQAMSAFLEHLDRIVKEAPPQQELANAKQYLSDSFPLQIDTPGKIAAMVAETRIFSLPDDYWDSFRSEIRNVKAEEALEAAKEHIQPDKALVVVVGRAAEIAPALKKYGPVKVVDANGKALATP